MRCWRVSSPAANIKQVTVTSTVSRGVGRAGRIPQATLVAMKTFPF
jgi:hypothetical protein